ncbi:MAG: ABC transporter substrate-binding protein, partial [Clostridia bacterium]|nr:ABC transporter substrate-binding protein [Clostridia bacterium]
MKIKKTITLAISSLLCASIALSTLGVAGCTNNTPKKDSIVIMSEELSGLFNPFYATSGADMEVVGMTQVGMLSTDNSGNPVVGTDLPTVALDFDVQTVGSGENVKSIYTFVIKNNLKFSDGVPLTMNDVLFNMYEYLDPVYAGSSTMYSTKIEGLTEYRTQKNYSDGGSAAEAALIEKATGLATSRIDELITVYEENGLRPGTDNSYSLSEKDMRNAIAEWTVQDGYKMAVATEAQRATMTNAD